MTDRKPPNSKDLLSSLPGSARGNGGPAVVTNHTLMPSSAKLPGHNPAAPKTASASPQDLLGSGRNIAKSQDSIMRSQFCSPDPSIYGPKRKAGPIKEQGSWWSDPGRQSTTSYSTYKSVPSTSSGSPSTAGSAPKVKGDPQKIAAAAAKEQLRAQHERKKMMGMKDRMLSTVCGDPNIKFGDPELHRVLGVVHEINQKLGLPFYDTGSWRVPTT